MIQRDPIYKGATYKFSVDIAVSGVPANVTGDTVKAYLDKNLDVDSPAIEITGDVETAGATGTVYFELTPEETDVPVGSYYLQAFWILAENGRKFCVADEKVKIVKKVPKVVS